MKVQLKLGSGQPGFHGVIANCVSSAQCSVYQGCFAHFS